MADDAATYKLPKQTTEEQILTSIETLNDTIRWHERAISNATKNIAEKRKRLWEIRKEANEITKEKFEKEAENGATQTQEQGKPVN